MIEWGMTTTQECEAACACGQLRITLAGDPAIVSSCHCFACQRRTGAVFGSTSFFARSQIVSIEGKDRTFRRAGDSGRFLTFHFCPTCGTNLNRGTCYCKPVWEDPRLAALRELRTKN